MFVQLPHYSKGLFTNCVYKKRGIGGPKISTFCHWLYHRNVNVVCERPPSKVKQRLHHHKIFAVCTPAAAQESMHISL